MHTMFSMVDIFYRLLCDQLKAPMMMSAMNILHTSIITMVSM